MFLNFEYTSCCLKYRVVTDLALVFLISLCIVFETSLEHLGMSALDQPDHCLNSCIELTNYNFSCIFLMLLKKKAVGV